MNYTVTSCTIESIPHQVQIRYFSPVSDKYRCLFGSVQGKNGILALAFQKTTAMVQEKLN